MSDEDKPSRRDPRERAVELRAEFSAPLPPPEWLARYEEISPGLADRIVSMAERQQQHRIALEAKDQDDIARYDVRELKYSAALTALGQILGFLVILSMGGGGVYLVDTGASGAGYAAILGALATLLLAYLWGRSPTKGKKG